MNAVGQNIRGVCLDVGGTLITPHPSVGHVYADVAKALGVGEFSPDLLNKQFLAGWKEKGFFDYSLDHWRDLVKRSFVGLAPVSDKLFAAIYEAFGEGGRWEIYKDVPATLEGLKERGIKLAAVSNWDKRLRALLDDLKLSAYFDAILISAEVGASKPDEKIFREAAQALGLPPENILHVGDSEREDLQGAQSAGMMSLLLSRTLGKSELRAQTIDDLSTLLRILDKPV